MGAKMDTCFFHLQGLKSRIQKGFGTMVIHTYRSFNFWFNQLSSSLYYRASFGYLIGS